MDAMDGLWMDPPISRRAFYGTSPHQIMFLFNANILQYIQYLLVHQRHPTYDEHVQSSKIRINGSM